MTSISPNPEPGTAPRRNRRSWALNLGLILAVFIAIQWWKARPMANGTAPELSGQLVTGEQFNLANLKGRPALVHFWATWCPVCKMGEEDIAYLARDHEVITVAMQSGAPDEINAYLAERELAFPVLPDPHGELAAIWGVPAVPATFFIDASGDVHSSTLGYTTKPGIEARLWAARNLGADSDQEQPNH